MTQSELEALLGRSLTATEAANRELYLEIALDHLEDMLCLDLTVEEGTRTFTPRPGYRTLWTGIFTSVSSVTVDGVLTTAYHAAQGDRREGDWFNGIVFDNPVKGDVTVTGTWGFATMPSDLQRLQAELFANVSTGYDGTKVSSKQVEDFRITLTDETDADSFASRNRTTLRKYSLCDVIDLRHSRSQSGR